MGIGDAELKVRKLVKLFVACVFLPLFHFEIEAVRGTESGVRRARCSTYNIVNGRIGGGRRANVKTVALH